MNIDFSKIEETRTPNFKGGEKYYAARRYEDGLNRITMGRLVPGASIGLHTHEDSSEIMFFTGGSGYVICDGERLPVSAGVVHYCPKGHSHTLVNDSSDTDLTFNAVVPIQ
ncbi:MAG: cupin domain-containing protein [Bacteroidales bacterium]|nr:cupin domain-containing protein [Bacteroidales bacterium]